MEFSHKSSEFIKRLKKIGHYNSNYDYSLVDYTNIKTKIIIIDKEYNSKHLISPEKLIYRNTKCFFKNALDKTHYMIKQFKKVHNDTYDYSECYYENYNDPVKIKCIKHGHFFQIPNNHKRGHGCPNCSKNKKISTEEIISEFKGIWGDLYDYSYVTYKGNHTKIKIICNNHGKFEITPSLHKRGWGCPSCNTVKSKGEISIMETLDKLKIKYNHQARFNGCKRKSKLSFDFYLPEYNMCIEYDGIQHFKPIEFFGGKEYFKIQLMNDQIKEDYCKDNNIKLLRIPYFKYNGIENAIFSSTKSN